MKYVVVGIGTDVGKTVVSSIFVTALQSDYFKPVQSGDLHHTDTDKVRALSETTGVFYPEAYRLNQPLSPHPRRSSNLPYVCLCACHTFRNK